MTLSCSASLHSFRVSHRSRKDRRSVTVLCFVRVTRGSFLWVEVGGRRRNPAPTWRVTTTSPTIWTTFGKRTSTRWVDLLITSYLVKVNLNYLLRAKIHECTTDGSRFRAFRTNRIPIKLIINNCCSDRPCFVIKVPASVKKIIGVQLTIPEYRNEVNCILAYWWPIHKFK